MTWIHTQHTSRDNNLDDIVRHRLANIYRMQVHKAESMDIAKPEYDRDWFYGWAVDKYTPLYAYWNGIHARLSQAPTISILVPKLGFIKTNIAVVTLETEQHRRGPCQDI